MLRYHPVLNEIIFRKADTEGLSHTKLSDLIGDENTAKGSARVADFRHTGKITTDGLKKLIRALEITADEVNNALRIETVAFEERSLAEWEEHTKVPEQSATKCNDCVFRPRRQADCCGHPMLELVVKELRMARRLGFIRREW